LQDIHCESCRLGKEDPRRTKKRTKVPKQYSLLETIQTDTTGPYPILGIDNTCYNVKFIECYSNFIHYAPIENLKASTILLEFQIFKERIERMTNRKIQKVQTDGGNEYRGVFLYNLIENGITKETGQGYKHHQPPKAERAHRTINALGRTMLVHSKLPKEYYVEAQRVAVYTYNRSVHSNATQSPYEMLFGTKPKISHLRIFESHGHGVWSMLATLRTNFSLVNNSTVKIKIQICKGHSILIRLNVCCSI